MAQKILTTFVDDIDGSDAEGTVRFGLDGTDYEIDLNPAHTKDLRDVLTRYAEYGRKIGRSASTSTIRARTAAVANGSSTKTPNLAAARDWLRSHPEMIPAGTELKDRGRLAGHLVALVPQDVLYSTKRPPATVIPLPVTPAASTADELAAGAATAGELAELAAQHDGEPGSIEETADNGKKPPAKRASRRKPATT